MLSDIFAYSIIKAIQGKRNEQEGSFETESITTDLILVNRILGIISLFIVRTIRKE